MGAKISKLAVFGDLTLDRNVSMVAFGFLKVVVVSKTANIMGVS